MGCSLKVPSEKYAEVGYAQITPSIDAYEIEQRHARGVLSVM